MKKNRVKILLWVGVLALFAMTAIIFKNTYALFETDAYGIANNDIGRWIIKLSNQLITSGLDEDITISNFVYESSATVADGYIAPGTSAYFDLIFDATDCDVAVKYDIEFLVDEIDYEDNINVSVEALNSGSTIRTDVNTYSGIVSLASIQNDEVITIRVTLNWDDDGNHDESDTELGMVENNQLAIPINVHAVQYLGETLVEYQDPNESNEGN